MDLEAFIRAGVTLIETSEFSCSIQDLIRSNTSIIAQTIPNASCKEFLKIYGTPLEHFDIVKIFKKKTSISIQDVPHSKTIFCLWNHYFHPKTKYSKESIQEFRDMCRVISNKITMINLCHTLVLIRMMIKHNSSDIFEILHRSIDRVIEIVSLLPKGLPNDLISKARPVRKFLASKDNRSNYCCPLEYHKIVKPETFHFFYKFVSLMTEYLNTISDGEIMRLIETDINFIIYRPAMRCPTLYPNGVPKSIPDMIRESYVSINSLSHYYFIKKYLFRLNSAESLIMEGNARPIEGVLIEI